MKDTKRQVLVSHLSKSIFKQLKDGPYLPCLALHYFDYDVSEDLITKAWEKLEPRWGKRSGEDIRRLVYVYWRREALRKWRKIDKGESEELVKSLYCDPKDYKAIGEISSYERISLFELAIFAGEKILCDIEGFIFKCPDLFTEYLISGRLNPRNPKTKIPYDKTPQKSKIVDGSIRFFKELPDLSWELSNEEAAQFTEFVWGCGHLFTGKSVKEERVNSDKELNQTSDEMKESEKAKLLRIIGLLTKAFIEGNKNKKQIMNEEGEIILGNGERGKTGKSNLLHELYQACERIGFDTDGLQKDTLGNAIKEGLKAVKDFEAAKASKG